MNKIAKNYLFIFVLLMVMPFIVKAAPSAPTVTLVGEDLYYAKSSSDAVSFRAGTSQSSATSYASSNGVSYISLPNGNYTVWAVDASGNYSSGTGINVTGSCSNVSVSNATDTGTTERCFIRTSSGTEATTTSATLATCASGYYFAVGPTYILTNNCGQKSFVGLGISARYCKKTYKYVCSQASVSYNSKLADLSVSTGDLTPGFSADTTTYRTSTSESSVKVNATLQNPNALFVDGYGPRTVSLNYGVNNIYVKTSISNNAGSSYLIKVTRADERNSNNYLSSLGLDGVDINPSFNANTVSYTAVVSDSTNSVAVKASLADDSATFVDGYGPRTVDLGSGINRITVKVKSETGKVRVYTIVVTKEGSGSDTPTPTTDGTDTLKSLELSSGNIAFDSNTFDYNATVDYDVNNIVVTAVPTNDTDTVSVNGGDNLEVGSLNQITITVTNADKTASNIYTIYVNRKEENITISNNSLLQDLKIDGYKIKFDAKTTDYSITLKEGVSQLNITATPSDSKSSITVEGNENLKSGSEIKIRVTAEDGSYTDYFINIAGVKKGGNVFLTVVVIILIILVLAYLVLRAMGYKIYFNMSAIKEYFEKIFAKKQ